jgi:hypothetical protein
MPGKSWRASCIVWLLAMTALLTVAAMLTIVANG